MKKEAAIAVSVFAAFFLSACLSPRRSVKSLAAAPGSGAGSSVEASAEKTAEKYLLPLKTARLLSTFGPRRRRFHAGIDIRESRGGGDPVYASKSGRVVEAGRRRGYGNEILLLHPDGCSTRYAHLREIRVKRGEDVKRGQVIGLVGRTGRATAPHLHFEIISPSGKPVDPAPYFFTRYAQKKT